MWNTEEVEPIPEVGSPVSTTAFEVTHQSRVVAGGKYKIHLVIYDNKEGTSPCVMVTAVKRKVERIKKRPGISARAQKSPGRAGSRTKKARRSGKQVS